MLRKQLPKVLPYAPQALPKLQPLPYMGQNGQLLHQLQPLPSRLQQPNSLNPTLDLIAGLRRPVEYAGEYNAQPAQQSQYQDPLRFLRLLLGQ